MTRRSHWLIALTWLMFAANSLLVRAQEAVVEQELQAASPGRSLIGILIARRGRF